MQHPGVYEGLDKDKSRGGRRVSVSSRLIVVSTWLPAAQAPAPTPLLDTYELKRVLLYICSMIRING